MSASSSMIALWWWFKKIFTRFMIFTLVPISLFIFKSKKIYVHTLLKALKLPWTLCMNGLIEVSE